MGVRRRVVLTFGAMDLVFKALIFPACMQTIGMRPSFVGAHPHATLWALGALAGSLWLVIVARAAVPAAGWLASSPPETPSEDELRKASAVLHRLPRVAALAWSIEWVGVIGIYAVLGGDLSSPMTIVLFLGAMALGPLPLAHNLGLRLLAPSLTRVGQVARRQRVTLASPPTPLLRRLMVHNFSLSLAPTLYVGSYALSTNTHHVSPLAAIGMLATFLAGVAVFTGICAVTLSESITTRINTMTGVVRDLAQQDHGLTVERLPDELHDEIGMLARHTNEMIDRLEESERGTKIMQIALETMNRALAQRLRDLDASHSALEKAKLAAEEATATKGEFLANMSHELRTPLHAILNYADLGLTQVANKGDLARPKLEKYLTNVRTSGTRLLSLVNALLDLSRLEAARMPFTFGRGDLRTVIELAHAELGALFAANSLRLSVRMETDDGSADFDPHRMSQVIGNILGNALRFAKPASALEVVLYGDASTLGCRIYNEGPSIPEDEIETIFDKFVQSSRVKNGSGGTGLGLSICRSIVTAHRGRIWARNADDGRVCFTFELPRLQDGGASTAAEHSSAA